MSLQTISPNRATEAVASLKGNWILEGCLDAAGDLTRTVIGKNPFSIGRGSGVDFRIPSRNVSKMHADLVIGGDTVFVRDLGSSNGTFVNGVRITQATPVAEGDLLQLADMEFRLLKAMTDSAVQHTHMSDRPEEGWLISRLHQVINEREFTMAFQPIVDVESGNIFAYEALVRCRVPGLENPLKLFDAATRMGLEERISAMCRDEAVRLLNTRPGNERLFVNTHANEFLGQEMIDSLAGLQQLLRNRPLVLEIHEAAVPDLSAMRSFRRSLKEIGVQLAYDDFGAGQSRLLELTEVPPDYLKFDRSLLMNLPKASASQIELVQTLVKIALDRGIAPLAEGLDNQETVDICKAMGFTLLQGFHLGRPATVDLL